MLGIATIRGYYIVTASIYHVWFYPDLIYYDLPIFIQCVTIATTLQTTLPYMIIDIVLEVSPIINRDSFKPIFFIPNEVSVIHQPLSLSCNLKFLHS